MSDWQDEDWRPIAGSRGYQISNMGRVMSNERLLKPCRYSTGYLVVVIYYRDGTRRRHGVHALVCENFIGPRPPLHECCHRNGLRDDNRLANLRYGTRSENMRDQYRHGTRVRGDTHPRAKLSYEIADSIRLRHAAGDSVRGMAREFKVDKKAIQNLLCGKTWQRPELDAFDREVIEQMTGAPVECV